MNDELSIRELSHSDLEHYRFAYGLSGISKTQIESDKPQLTLGIFNAAQEIEAHASAWWTNTPKLNSQSSGLIGHYAAASATAAHLLIHHMEKVLQQQQCAYCIAPMNGNTWRSYRFTTELGDHAPFFLEPYTPPAWAEQFQTANYSALAHYTSSLAEDMSIRDERIPKIRQRLQPLKIHFRPIQLENFQHDLQHIYNLSVASFKHNFLYTDIDFESFSQLYIPVRQYIKPELTLLAFDGDILVGFIFAIPDYLQQGKHDTFIIKTVAISPLRKYAGLGALLVDQLVDKAQQLGYRHAIHALMHDSNKSLVLSHRYGRPIRGYTLFVKHLQTNTGIAQ
ncbi:MAG: GNAT family N-acetyltransferase [Gammaproteobacteria bacterium]|nr:GNAT family N-acetyltransferase [Gammaproteobacteria bacterium]